MTDEKAKEQALQLLRKFLNKEIKGKGTDAILEALAAPGKHLIKNVEAVHDSMYIVSAEGRYLDVLLADRDTNRPLNVGLEDEIFREIGIEVTNRKQVRDLINKILEIIYGIEYSRASIASTVFEPYSLVDGSDLRLRLDDGSEVSITFSASQFQNISQASAQEVADAILRELRKKGVESEVNVVNNGSGNFVTIFSPTTGPSSTISVPISCTFLNL